MTKLGSWIKPEFRWAKPEATFACRVQADDRDLGGLLANGRVSVSVSSLMKDRLLGLGPSVRAYCYEWLRGTVDDPRDTSFYMYDLFHLRGNERLVLLGLTPDPETVVASSRLSRLQIEPEYAVLVSPLPESTRARTEAVMTALRASDRPLSRDGLYRCSPILLQDRTQAGIVRWTEREDRPPALEIKRVLEQSFRSAFRKPRSRHHDPPESHELGIVSRVDLGEPFDIPGLEELSDVRPTADGKDGKDLFKHAGFEAIAWYQSFHSYDDSAWGIHFDAPKLDALASSLARDLNKERQRNQLACRLALRLTAAHELFHARIDFAAAWLELVSRKRRFLPYSENVYKKLQFTSDWLEEALANWSAHLWLRSNLEALSTQGLIQDPAYVLGVIEDWLDFSPEGYNGWRRGATHEAWDRLASELARGIPFADISVYSGLPLSGLIQDGNLFDLRLDDVPVYVVGDGLVAGALFSAPCRREVHRVLKYSSYRLLTGRGKGSHELWEGPNGKAFTLPARDPLSLGVFHSLLDHFGWSKSLYMQQIRPLI